MYLTLGIFDRPLDELIDGVKASQKRRGMYASGKSARSLRKTSNRSGGIISLQIHGAAYFRQQQLGRKPTRNKTSNGKTLVEALREWAKFKGIKINEWALAKKIHRDGIKVPNRFNDGRVLSDPLAPKRVSGLLKTAIRPELIKNVRSQLFA